LVVFLHGFPETAESYREILPAVAAAGYYAVAVNQRGYSPGARPEPVDASESSPGRATGCPIWPPTR
jgi:pimeloyl-ACP methyl ester carboxylesterase